MKIYAKFVHVNIFECMYSLSSTLYTQALALFSLQLNAHIHEEEEKLYADEEELTLPSL